MSLTDFYMSNFCNFVVVFVVNILLPCKAWCASWILSGNNVIEIFSCKSADEISYK